MSEASIEHVSDTAFLVAYYRAVESARRDALFRDPLAARIAGEKGRALGESFKTANVTGWSVAIRTVVIDDFIRNATLRGVDTVLSLGAGLDTRPYRLEMPRDVTWIEVDYPDVIAFKNDVLTAETPKCRLERVGLDLADAVARRRLLADVDANANRILVLTEGVVLYLEETAVAALSDDLRALSHIDSWIVDYFSREAHAYRERAGATKQMKQAPFKFQPPDWFGFFSAHGWRVREIQYLPEVGPKLGRPFPLPLKFRLLRPLLLLAFLFMSAEKRARMTQYVGYALLEPDPAFPSHPDAASG